MRGQFFLAKNLSAKSMQNPEKVWKFPCTFPIKAVGKTDPAFEVFVLSVIRKHVPNLAENAIESRASKDGKYLALTVIIQATSKEQLDAIYQELSASDLVIMAL